MRTTYHDSFVAALQRTGHIIIATRSTRYTVLARSQEDPLKYFVGRAGALRVGRTAAQSRPAPESWKMRLLNNDTNIPAMICGRMMGRAERSEP